MFVTVYLQTTFHTYFSNESLTAERKQVRKIRNSSVTEEYQDGENSYCEFFGLVPFMQLAIQIGL
jgi:hypothetical protein